MRILSNVTLFWNILVILILLFGLFIKFESPKRKAVYGYTLAFGMIPYLLLLSVYIIAEFIIYKKLEVLFLIFCILSPFIIGRMVKCETLKKYTIIQILCFLVSLFYLV